MPVKLSVVNEQADEGSPSTYLFDTDEVTIGRGDENHLTLGDPKRLVSTKHAVVRRQHGTYRLIDRGSKNFTYVGNQRITAQDSYELSDGDVFRIGDFRIEFQMLDTEAGTNGAAGETVFDHSFENPMQEPVGRLVGALSDLGEAYRDAAPQRRDDILEEALDGVDEELQSTDVPDAVLSVLRDRERTASASGETTESSATPIARRPSATAESEVPPSSSGASDEVDRVLGALGDALAKVIRIPWRFRHEFIGQTVMQAPETQFLYSGDGDTLISHLLDSSLSKEERRKRLGYLDDAVEALQVHQVAMLNGYKASVTTGVAELLERIDPERHRTEIMEENAVFEYVPVLASPSVLDRVSRETQELRMEDGGSAETRIFRPAFTKAYLARMTAPGFRDDEGSETAT